MKVVLLGANCQMMFNKPGNQGQCQNHPHAR